MSTFAYVRAFGHRYSKAPPLTDRDVYKRQTVYLHVVGVVELLKLSIQITTSSPASLTG